jgi:hypothetical protein
MLEVPFVNNCYGNVLNLLNGIEFSQNSRRIAPTPIGDSA